MVRGEGEPDEKQAVLGVSVLRRSLQRVAASAPGAGAGAGGAFPPSARTALPPPRALLTLGSKWLRLVLFLSGSSKVLN